MAWFRSRELLDVLDVKPHVLRYWEQQLPLVRSSRDDTGHRVWSSAQVRMLRRVRHLVVRRGMSVQAAGELIVREAETTPGNVKGRLEALRDGLLDVLGRLRAGTASETGGSPASRGDARDAVPAEAESPEDPSFPIPMDFPERAARRLRRPNEALMGPRMIGSSDDGISPSTFIPLEDTLLVAYRHLFACTTGDRTITHTIPRVLRDILSLRLSGKTCPVVVCAPYEEYHAYRRALGAGIHVLPVRSFTARGRRWFSPTAATLSALVAAAPELSGFTAGGIRRIYLWAPENPDSPLDISTIPRDNRLEETAVTILAHAHSDGYILDESFIIDFPAEGEEENFPGGVKGLLEVGRWSVGPVRRNGVGKRREIESGIDQPSVDADSMEQGWRYDVWIRDFLTGRYRWIVVPRSNRPKLWRGYDWIQQLPAVWPEIGRRD